MNADWIPPLLDNPVTFVSIARLIFGGILVFFCSGFAWTLVFFPNLSRIERIPLSVGLSLAITALAGIVLSMLFHVPLNGFTTTISTIILTIIPLAIYLFRRYRTRRVTGDEPDNLSS